MDKLTSVEIEHEMKGSYIDYAMSVIVARALPDVRDGLKPVHRRILYAMDNLNLTPDKPFKKSATIVGDVLGKYHPHGDASVYDALVRLAQDFNLRYPLVLGHGNFGSIDGDSAAAYRYTEAKMSKMSLEMLVDIDKDTVDFTDNFDASLQEPSVLPSRIPNLLVNGSMGIAVGMATNIPPHNMGDIVDALVALIDDPNINIEDLIAIVKGPDFPTGGLIMGYSGCHDTYRTGKGTITMRAKTEVVENDKGRSSIIVTEIPYQLNKAKLIEQIADRVKNKYVTNVSDLRDESNRDGIRIVIELNQNANPKLVLNQLFKHTNLQCNFGAIMLALVKGEPKLLNLKDMLNYYLLHREDVITRRTRFELKKALARIHILEGLKIALDNIDEVIEIIRNSSDNKEAKEKLHEKFNLSDLQAQAILEMQLQRLTGLQRKKLDEEHEDLTKRIEYLNSLLADELKIKGVIRDDLLLLKEKYSEKRRTKIDFNEAEFFNKDELLDEKDVVVTISETGYIKRMPLDLYKTQRRGGRGINGASLKEDDYIKNVCVTTTHSNIFFLTDKGKIYRLKRVYEIAETGRNAKGTAMINLLSNFSNDEKIKFLFSVRDFDLSQDLVIATASGFLKRTPLYEYRNLNKNGLIAIKLNDGDEIVGAEIVSRDDSKEFMIISKNGKCIRFPASKIPVRRSRGTVGVKTFNFNKISSVSDDVSVYDIDDINEDGEQEEKQDNAQPELLEENDVYEAENDVEVAEDNTSDTEESNSDEVKEKDKLVSFLDVSSGKYLLVVTSNGFAVRTPLDKYPTKKNKSGVGINVMRQTDRKGVVASASMLDDNDEVLIMSREGTIIRTNSAQLPTGGRMRQGNTFMKMSDGDFVSSVSIIKERKKQEKPVDLEDLKEVYDKIRAEKEQSKENTEEQTEENVEEQNEENNEEQNEEIVVEQTEEAVEEQEDEPDNEQVEKHNAGQIEMPIDDKTYEFEDEDTEDVVSEVKGNYQRHFNKDGYPIASDEDSEDSPVDLEEESQKDDLPEDLDSEEELKKKDE